VPVQSPTKRRVRGATRASHATSSASCVAWCGVSVPVMISVSIGPRMEREDVGGVEHVERSADLHDFGAGHRYHHDSPGDHERASCPGRRPALVLSSFGRGINDIQPKDFATPTGARARVGRPALSFHPAEGQLDGARSGGRVGDEAAERSRHRQRDAADDQGGEPVVAAEELH
jgi:hypothetical protein